jgi:hypothetical protein
MPMQNRFADLVGSRAFDLVFWITIFMSTVGLADLFASDRQKQAVQDWFETLTLKLADIDSTKWPSYVSTRRGAGYVAASSLLPTVALIPIAIHRTLVIYRPFAHSKHNQVIISLYAERMDSDTSGCKTHANVPQYRASPTAESRYRPKEVRSCRRASDPLACRKFPDSI